MSIYRDNAAQVWPSNKFEAVRNTISDSSHWIELNGDGETFYKLLIKGATAEESDIIVEALNAPARRIRADMIADAQGDEKTGAEIHSAEE
mgnify:FL=1